MNLFSPKNIKEILQRYGAAPLKSLGQNFLVSAGALEKIIQAADIKGEDVVLEIGPGLGVLTRQLGQKAKRVVAVEKDKKYSEILKETLADLKNIEIIHADILKTNPPENPYKIVSNLPYNITSPVIRKFLEEKNPPEYMILMVQKEVAKRICASPPEMSLLAVSVQFYGQPEIIDYVSKGSFWPQPKVDSAILRLKPHSKYRNVDISKFFTVVRAGFSAPRKQLAPNLASKLKISRQAAEETLRNNEIDPKQRAETLSVEDWVKISASL